jgi:hypothetical protein
VTKSIEFPAKPEVSAAAKDLVLRMTDRSVSSRIKLEDICGHAWVSPVRAGYPPTQIRGVTTEGLGVRVYP